MQRKNVIRFGDEYIIEYTNGRTPERHISHAADAAEGADTKG